MNPTKTAIISSSLNDGIFTVYLHGSEDWMLSGMVFAGNSWMYASDVDHDECIAELCDILTAAGIEWSVQ